MHVCVKCLKRWFWPWELILAGDAKHDFPLSPSRPGFRPVHFGNCDWVVWAKGAWLTRRSKEVEELINFSGNATGDTSKNSGLLAAQWLHLICRHRHLHHQHLVVLLFPPVALAHALLDHLPARGLARLCHVHCQFHQLLSGRLVVMWKQEWWSESTKTSKTPQTVVDYQNTANRPNTQSPSIMMSHPRTMRAWSTIKFNQNRCKANKLIFLTVNIISKKRNLNSIQLQFGASQDNGQTIGLIMRN